MTISLKKIVQKNYLEFQIKIMGGGRSGYTKRRNIFFKMASRNKAPLKLYIQHNCFYLFKYKLLINKLFTRYTIIDDNSPKGKMHFFKLENFSLVLPASPSVTFHSNPLMLVTV